MPLLTVAVSSRALFDFEEENEIFKLHGEEAYVQTQLDRLERVAKPGVAFLLAKKLLAMNNHGEKRVEIIVLSRNDPVTGLRVFRAIAENGLNIQCGCFVRGRSPFRYLPACGANLFLSAFADDVRAALENGIPAAHVKGGDSLRAEELVNIATPLTTPIAKKKTSITETIDESKELRIAFDGDAVLFGDESERVYQEQGLDAFQQQEKEMVAAPLQPGPFKPFLEKLKKLRQASSNSIRTALVTARGAPAHERPIRTLMEWGLEVDEAMFLSGKNKKEFLRAFNPDFFFDDQVRNVEGILEAGHVPTGIKNEKN